MTKQKLDKKSKNIIIRVLVIAFILEFFIENATDIIILGFSAYFVHKHIGSTKEYDDYEFSDKSKFYKDLKLFVYIFDIYVIIRIIFLLLNPHITAILGELLLIYTLFLLYQKHLTKKYVINTNILLVENTVVFARRKFLLAIGGIIFIVFSAFTINTFKSISTENHIKYGIYEYNITGSDGNRKIELHNLGCDYMNVDEYDYMNLYENYKNLKSLNPFIENIKSLMKKQIVKTYSFISMIIFIILCVIEGSPKDDKTISKVISFIGVAMLIFSIITFNIDLSNEEMYISSYFIDLKPIK